MGLGVYGISLLINWSDGGITIAKFFILVFAICFGVMSYLLLTYLLKSPEMIFLTEMVTERWFKKS